MTSRQQLIPSLLLISLSILFIPGCEKTQREMQITTGAASQITSTTAVVTGTIVDLGEKPIQYGHCFSTAPNPSITSPKTELGIPEQTGAFTSMLSQLTPETTYYVRAYIRNNNTTVYGDEITFTTGILITVPVVTTNHEPMGVTATTITILGEVTADGNATVTERGFFIGPSEEPVTSGTKVQMGDGLGQYSTTVENLTPATTYYYVAYAINSAGTGYGAQRQTTTLAEPVPPSVTTTMPTDITDKSATVGGIVTSQGDSEVMERGVFYGTSPMPQNTGTKLSLGTGTGIFSGPIGNLQHLTKYYIVAFASNNSGTGYGTELEFTTLQQEVVEVTNPTTGKIWMDRNLGAGRVATGSTDSEAYGDLFQWGRTADGHEKRNSPTTTTLSTSDTPGHGNFILLTEHPYDWRTTQNDNLWQATGGINNPCPANYRVPTEAEWQAERQSWGSNTAAGAFASPLKLTVAGLRSEENGALAEVGTIGSYWSTSVSSNLVWHLFFDSSDAAMDNYSRATGRSVRCIKDQ